MFTGGRIKSFYQSDKGVHLSWSSSFFQGLNFSFDKSTPTHFRGRSSWLCWHSLPSCALILSVYTKSSCLCPLFMLILQNCGVSFVGLPCFPHFTDHEFQSEGPPQASGSTVACCWYYRGFKGVPLASSLVSLNTSCICLPPWVLGRALSNGLGCRL